MLTLKPAYGRDYKSKKSVLLDFNANKDFIICDLSNRYDGKPINKQDMELGFRMQFRYNKNRNVFSHEVK